MRRPFAIGLAVILLGGCASTPPDVTPPSRPATTPAVTPRSSGKAFRTPVPQTTKAAPKTSKAAPTPKEDERFGTCTEVKSAGLGPYVKGKDPEYYWYRDQDKDGVACE